MIVVLAPKTFRVQIQARGFPPFLLYAEGTYVQECDSMCHLMVFVTQTMRSLILNLPEAVER